MYPFVPEPNVISPCTRVVAVAQLSPGGPTRPSIGREISFREFERLKSVSNAIIKERLRDRNIDDNFKVTASRDSLGETIRGKSLSNTFPTHRTYTMLRFLYR